jgi:hypothetical protein
MIKRREEQAVQEAAPREVVTRDGHAGRHREHGGQRGRGQRQPQAVPERLHEVGVIESRAEPAQRELRGRQGQRVLGRERDDAHHQQRCEHEGDHQGVEQQGDGSVFAHGSA